MDKYSSNQWEMAGNPFFEYEQGQYNSVKNGRILPINNPIPLIPDTNMYAKLEEIP